MMVQMLIDGVLTVVASGSGIVVGINRERYDESLDNLTQADVYFGRGEGLL